MIRFMQSSRRSQGLSAGVLPLILAATVGIPRTSLSQPVTEPLGPSSRRTPIAISEIMYKPAPRSDGLNTEFIELYNSNPWPEDISSFRLAGRVEFTFPPATSISSNGFVVVAGSPADLQTVYGLSNVFGPYTNGLKTSGTLRLHDEQGSTLLGVAYNDKLPWAMGADGTGHSIVLARASYGERDSRAWERSDRVGGTPGSADSFPADPLRSVMLNEILAHTDPPAPDAIELYNHSKVGLDLSGCTLSDDPYTNKFVVPPGRTIAPRGYVRFTETELGFALDAAGETVYLKNPDDTCVLDALRFEAQENGVAYGRYPDGATEWYRLSGTTLGSANVSPLVSPVGFNEIMYHPLSENDDDQYVELFNRGPNTVNLSGWKLVDGISFTFPTNTLLSPKSYLVVARAAARLMTNYPQLNPTNLVGNFSGRLSGSGERLALAMPDTLVNTNALGLVVTNLVDIVVDEVTYGTGGRWGRWSDGGGSSLELVDPRADKRLAANWADSDETAKAPWATIATTAVIDNGTTTMSPVQLGLLDAGECLVDDVEVQNATGLNCVGNGGFENGMTSLSFIGNHSRSSLEANAGFAGSVALHLRTADEVQIGPNGVSITLTSTSGLSSGRTATLRFKARWLRGCPEPLLRFWGCSLEATGRLPVPANLGTPGLPNSQATTNTGPAIYQVRHDPTVPAADEPVVVTARVSDPDGLASLTLQYRFDPLTSVTNLTMNDTGVGGDLVAGDGIFSATLPGRPTNAIAFILLATDTSGVTSRFPELAQDSAPVRECAVFFGEPTPTNLFGTYHLWLTQTNVNRWKALPIMSNEDIDGTLVYNNRVIYNMGGRYAGGPWHQNYDSPAGYRACHYIWSMPKDDLLLGTTSFNQMHWPGNDIQHYDTINTMYDDATLQREQAAYMFLRAVGVPWSYRRFVAVYVNGVRRGMLMEDAFRPTPAAVKDAYFPDDTGGQLYRLQRWYQQGTSPSPFEECKLRKYTTTGSAWKPARYRPNWALRKSPGSLSDFTNVYALVTAANAHNQPDYVNLLEDVADMENWMRTSAANQAAGNWDCFGSRTGQNADGWVSDQHRWTLFTIDLSICLDNPLSGVSLFSMSDFAWQQIIGTPKFRRMYCRALNELVNGVMQPEVIHRVLDAKYAAFRAAGLNPSAPTSTKSWIANQRATIISQLASLNATPFSVASTTLTASSNAATLSGTAPVDVVSLSINGAIFTPTWTNVTGWSLLVPAVAGTDSWTVRAHDRFGNTIGDALTVTVENPSLPEAPVGSIVFNEIMFSAPAPEAEYVELFNCSTNTTFDLSGWIVNGLDYTFPPGSVLPPQRYLVLARSAVAFATTYSALIPVFGTFTGGLQQDGETLSIIKPGTAPEPDLLVDRVRYEASAPWPTLPLTSPGTSLQLLDATRDNSRVANWGVVPALSATPGAANAAAPVLPEFPTLWLNELQAENLTGPSDNFDERDPWIEIYNSGTAPASLDGLYLGTNYNSPAQWAFPAEVSVAPGQFLVVWLDGQPEQTSGFILHAGFRLDARSGSIALSRFVNGQPQIVDYLNIGLLPANHSYGDVPDGQPFYRQPLFLATPANTNNTALPAISVFINEWMGENAGYRFNPATGKYDDWFELHNPSSTPANLAGFYLTDSFDDPQRCEIPAGFQVPPQGFLLVWADERTSANSNGTDLHVNFKLSKDGEAIGLFTPVGTAVDAVIFGAQSANVTEGRYPDGGGLRLFMPEPSPGSANRLPPASAPPAVIGFTFHPDHSLALTVQASPGHRYRAEFKNSLTAPTWTPLGAEQMATGLTLTLTDNTGEPKRFYRIRQVD